MKSTFIINDKQVKKEIFITTPDRDGEMVIKDDVLTYDYGNSYIPVYRDCRDGHKRIVRGSMEILQEGEKTIGTATGYIFHTDNSDVEVQYKDRNSTKQIMPSGDGYILNSNSAIDCGEIEMVDKQPKLSEPNAGKTSKDLEE